MHVSISYSTFTELAGTLLMYVETDHLVCGDTINFNGITVSVDQDDVAERIEDGTATLQELAWAIRKARSLSDEQLMSYDVFGPTEGEVIPLRDKMVRGRKEYTDYTCGVPIRAGERHRNIVEVFEGQMADTRHCELACWMTEFGRSPHQVFENGRYSTDPEFIELYTRAINLIALEDALGRAA
jgi:hypothetical protein